MSSFAGKISVEREEKNGIKYYKYLFGLCELFEPAK